MGKFPTYDQMKSAAYSSIVNGANGILWWGFVSVQGIEGEWYTRHNQQPYYDFKRLSDEVAPLEPYLIAPPQPQFLTSVSDSKIETLVKADSSQVVIFPTAYLPVRSRMSTSHFPALPQERIQSRSIQRSELWRWIRRDLHRFFCPLRSACLYRETEIMAENWHF